MDPVDPVESTEPDDVDRILEQWARERPDVDVSAMAVIGRLSRTERAVDARLCAVFAAYDLQAWEFDVLATLRRHASEGPMTPGLLLDATMVTSGAMTNRLDRLERRGLIGRSKSPTDGRQVLVELTDEGRELVDRALVAHAENESRLIAGLDDDERRTLVDLLRRLDRAARSPDAHADG